jgi:SAM-dependent methyltransferase
MDERTRRDYCDRVKRNVTHNFDQSAEAYQAFEDQFHFFADLTLRLAGFIDMQPHCDVLDVGCGSGISARALHAAHDCRVLGVDLSPRMVQAGRALCASGPIDLVVGDGEQLVDLIGARRFDYVLYNASIFIFPDVDRTVRQAAACLRAGGKIAFSFYPDLSDAAGNDLLEEAFRFIGQPPPRHRVITTYAQACAALEAHCGPVTHGQWVQPWDIDLLKAFYAIPAQSASLFPGLPYAQRRERVAALLERLDDGQTRAIWRMAQAARQK